MSETCLQVLRNPFQAFRERFLEEEREKEENKVTNFISRYFGELDFTPDFLEERNFIYEAVKEEFGFIPYLVLKGMVWQTNRTLTRTVQKLTDWKLDRIVKKVDLFKPEEKEKKELEGLLSISSKFGAAKMYIEQFKEKINPQKETKGKSVVVKKLFEKYTPDRIEKVAYKAVKKLEEESKEWIDSFADTFGIGDEEEKEKKHRILGKFFKGIGLAEKEEVDGKKTYRIKELTYDPLREWLLQYNFG